MEAAVAESRKTPAIVQGMTLARAGRAYAKVGNKAAARAALDASSKFLGKAISGDTPPWAYWVDETRLKAQIGRALFDLGDYGPAERHLTSAITACQGKYPRDRATWQGRIAIAQLRTGRLEEGCATAQQTVDLLADQVDSERGIGFLRIFKDDLNPYTGSPTARGFLEYSASRLDI